MKVFSSLTVPKMLMFLHKELGEWMTNNMTVVRFNKRLEETIDKIKELKQRYKQHQH